MRKKTIFTISSVLVVVATLFMACEKNTATTTAAAATTGGTTGSTGANTMVVDGTSHTVVTSTNVIGSTFVIGSSSAPGPYPTINLNFSGTSAPAAGSYTANANYPGTGNCGAVVTPATSVTWTVVTCNMTVTSGSSRNVSFTGATFTDGAATHTVTANLPF